MIGPFYGFAGPEPGATGADWGRKWGGAFRLAKLAKPAWEERSKVSRTRKRRGR